MLREEWEKEWQTGRSRNTCRMRGTYSGSLHRPTVHIGDSRTGLDWALPVAKESEQQLRDGATAVVRLQEGKVEKRKEESQEEERRNKLHDKFTAQGGNEYRWLCRNKEERNNTNEWNVKASWGWGGTYPAGAAPLALCKEQGGTLQHCPRGSPVLPACHS